MKSLHRGLLRYIEKILRYIEKKIKKLPSREPHHALLLQHNPLNKKNNLGEKRGAAPGLLLQHNVLKTNH
jgi:hypothetical protein